MGEFGFSHDGVWFCVCDFDFGVVYLCLTRVYSGDEVGSLITVSWW